MLPLYAAPPRGPIADGAAGQRRKFEAKRIINSLLPVMGEVMQKIRPDLDTGHNIQSLRRGAGMTQDQVVAKLQLMGLRISKSTYAKLETNRMNIKVSELVALKEMFQAEYWDFFAGLV